MAKPSRDFFSNVFAPKTLSSLLLTFCVAYALLNSPESWAKEEFRKPQWTWVHMFFENGEYSSPQAVVDALNQESEQLYTACITNTHCNSCGKLTLGPPVNLGYYATKINGQINSFIISSGGGTTTNYTPACTIDGVNYPAVGPTSGDYSGATGIGGNLQCPVGSGQRNSGYHQETVQGTLIAAYDATCVTEVPDPPKCCDGKVKDIGTPAFGNPIDAMTGAKVDSETDYTSADGLLRIDRSYSSLPGHWTWEYKAALADFTDRSASLPSSANLISNIKLTPPGGGSSANVPMSFPLTKTQPDAGQKEAWVIAANGRRTVFTEGAVNSFTTLSPDKPTLGLISGPNSTQQWLLRSQENNFQIFDAGGELIQKVFPDGKSLTYASGSGTLTVTATPGGRQLVYSRSNPNLPQGEYDVVTLPDASQIHYAIDGTGMVTSVTFADTTTTTYLYDEPAYSGVTTGVSPNWLTGVRDENNARHATYTYDGSGPVATELAGGVNKYTFAFNPAYGFTSVSSPPLDAQTVVRWGVGPDGEQRLTSRSLPAGSGSTGGTASIAYDVSGNVTSVSDYNGNDTCYAYDQTRGIQTARLEGLAGGVGCPASIATYTVPINTSQRKISTQWHPTWNLPAAIAAPRKITTYVYNGQPDPNAGGALANCTSGASLPDGSAVTVVCSKIEQATGDSTGSLGFAATATGTPRKWTYTYNSYGQVLTADGPRTDVSDVTTYTYYGCATGYQCGRVNTVTNAAGHVTTYSTYNAHGQPLTITDPNGTVTTLAYDQRQRLISRTVGNEQTSFTYWPTGLLKRVTLPDASFLDYTYDNAHRLTGIADSEGNHIAYILDTAGNRIAENSYDSLSMLTGARLRVADELSRISQEIGAAGTAAVTTNLGYDNNGNHTSISAPLSRNTSQTYDELNRLSTVTDPGSGLTTYGYDALDQLISVTDPRSLATTYTYNGLGDLTQQVSPDTGTTANTYDSGGNLQTSTDARSAITTYTYDALNRVKTAAFKIGATTDQTITYNYDAGANGKGRLTSASDSNHSMAWIYDAQGRVTGKSQVVAGITKSAGYAYTNGQLTTLTTPSGQVVTYGNANNQITSISVNGTAVLSSVLYEPFGPPKQWTWSNGTLTTRAYDDDGKVTQVVSAGTHNYAYDDAFRITGITDTVNSALSWTYGYDLLDRLNSATKTGTTIGYTFDANGNRQSQTGTTASTYAVSATSNRVSSITGALPRTYGYNAAGNTTSYETKTLAYNNRGRLKSLTNSGTTTTYVYDALGQLVLKTGAMFFYDEAGHLLGLYLTSGALTYETVWMGDIPVAALYPKTGGGVDIFYIHTDHLNTPRKITRPSDNKARWRWDSDPFGTTAANENPEALGVFKYGLRFPGQIYLSEAGLHYNYFRDYDPATGRYPQSDPIGLRGGINTYAYVKGNPVSLVDPFGLDTRTEPRPCVGCWWPFPTPTRPPGGWLEENWVKGWAKDVWSGTQNIGKKIKDFCTKGEPDCKKAREECIEECLPLLDGKSGAGYRYNDCMTRCMVGKGCAGSNPDFKT